VKQTVPNCRIVVASYNEKQQAMADAMLSENQIDVETMVGRTPELMKAATVCVACSGSVSMELLYYRKPTIIVFKIKRWMMWAQTVLFKAKFITLVNLMATNDIKKKTWAPYSPDAKGAEEVLMPEYLTTGNPSGSVAARVIRWLEDEGLRAAKITELDALASRFAIPGATDQAVNYLLSQLGVTRVVLSGAEQSSGELNDGSAASRKSA